MHGANMKIKNPSLGLKPGHEKRSDGRRDRGANTEIWVRSE